VLGFGVKVRVRMRVWISAGVSNSVRVIVGVGAWVS
jgi:hypothetical protein